MLPNLTDTGGKYIDLWSNEIRPLPTATTKILLKLFLQLYKGKDVLFQNCLAKILGNS